MGEREKAQADLGAHMATRLRNRVNSCDLQTKWGNHFFGDANDVQLFRDAANFIEKMTPLAKGTPDDR